MLSKCDDIGVTAVPAVTTAPFQSPCSLLSHGSILDGVRCGLVAGVSVVSSSSCSISARDTLVPYVGNWVNKRKAVSSSLVVDVDKVSSSDLIAVVVESWATKPQKLESMALTLFALQPIGHDVLRCQNMQGKGFVLKVNDQHTTISGGRQQRYSTVGAMRRMHSILSLVLRNMYRTRYPETVTGIHHVITVVDDGIHKIE